MSERSFNNMELNSSPDIFQKIGGYLDYGIDHGGWNRLLSLEDLERDIFVIDTAWQEAEGKLADNEDIQKKVAERINLLNDKFDELKRLSSNIKINLLAVVDIQESQNLNNKKDFGVIMRAIESLDINRLVSSELKILDELNSLLNDFVVEYEEWIINKENNIEKLKKILRDISRMSIVIKGGKPRVNFPTADQANKTTRGDGAWGWKR